MRVRWERKNNIGHPRAQLSCFHCQAVFYIQHKITKLKSYIHTHINISFKVKKKSENIKKHEWEDNFVFHPPFLHVPFQRERLKKS